MIVLAIDALELSLVEEFNCTHLMQDHYGKTDISEFSEPRTMVLWSSFATGKNQESRVLADGREMWNVRFDVKDTFFSGYKSPKIIDLPGFSYDLKAHEKSRQLLKAYFESSDPDGKESIRKKYNDDAFSHHRKISSEFLKALKDGQDFLLGYFSLIDVIGHLNFGNRLMMKTIYREFDG
ncbi:MAG: hypothetical protein ABH879_08825, partial [archaeon]